MLSTQLNEQRGQNHFYVIDAFSRILDSKVLKVIVNIISFEQNSFIFYQNIIINRKKIQKYILYDYFICDHVTFVPDY